MRDENGKWLVCCIRDCEGVPLHGGMCINHHRLTQKYGSPVASKMASWVSRKLPVEERFKLLIRKTPDGCWFWKGNADRDGYGLFHGEYGGQIHNRAHRFSYALHKGKIPTLLYVCHSCDTPRCVNPDHLFLGTSRDNSDDKYTKGRANMPFGETHQSAVLTEAQAVAILSDPRPHSQIAAEYKVHIQTISSLKTRASWAHLGIEKGVKAPRISPRRGKSKAGITPEIVREIRASTERGVDLAARFGIKPQDVSDIRHRRSWAHID